MSDQGLGYRERTWDEFLSYDARLECQGTSFGGGACAGHPWLAGNYRYAQAGSDGVILVVCPRHWQLAQAQHRTRAPRGWWDGTTWRMLASGEEPPIEDWVEPSRSVPRTIAVIGCGIAALLIVAAVALWVIDKPRHYFTDRFCADGIEAVYTVFNKSYLNAPAR